MSPSKHSKMTATIWTIGHSTRIIEELWGLLTGARIKVIADVRRFPGSRRYPQSLAADSVAIRWGVTGTADDPKSPGVESYLQFCKEFCAEDRTQLERLQRGLTSRSYVPGPLAPDHAEGTVWDIIQYMARRLGARESAAPMTYIDSRG